MRGTLGEFMTRVQAAKILNISPQAVSQLMGKGKIGYAQIDGRRFPNRGSVEIYGRLVGHITGEQHGRQ